MTDSWDFHKETLRQLYIVRGEKLKNVMKHMKEQHNFQGSEGQYQRRFKDWGFKKNSTGDGWKTVHRIIRRRKKQAKASEVYKEGRNVPAEKLTKERRHDFWDISEQYDSAASLKTPDGFIVCTPRCATTPIFYMNNLPCLLLFDHLKARALPRTEASIGPTLPDASELVGRVLGEVDQLKTSDDVQMSSSQDSLGSSRSLRDDSVSIFAGTAREDRTSEDRPFLELAPLARLTSRASSIQLEVLQEFCPHKRLQPLLSMLHLASNNLLTEPHTSEAFTLMLQNNDLVLLKSILSGKSQAAKAVAKAFLAPAVISSNVAVVKLLLDTGIDPNSPLGYEKQKCLILASSRDDIDMMRFLLDRGADVNTVNGYGEGPLANYKMSWKLEAVQLLLQYGADVNARPTHGSGRTPLGTAAYCQNFELVKLLISHGADANAQWKGYNPGGSTALLEAVHFGNLSMIKLLSQSGADMTNALPTAASNNDLHLLQYLIDLGADIDAHSNSDFAYHGRWLTALQTAVFLELRGMVRSLLNLGADVNARAHPSQGATALQAAASKGDKYMVQILMDAGAEINAEPAEQGGRTALQAAIESKHFDLVPLMISLGADVNSNPAKVNGISAYEAAVKHGSTELVQLLLDSHTGIELQGRPAEARAIADRCVSRIPELRRRSRVNFDNTYVSLNKDHQDSPLHKGTKSRTAQVTNPLLAPSARSTSKRLLRLPYGEIQMADLLFFLGAKVLFGSEDSKDPTDLYVPATMGVIEILLLFVNHGALEKSGALQEAAQRGYIPIVQLLISEGADVNAAPLRVRSKVPKTALQAAASTGRLELVRILLDAGALTDINPSVNEVGTALQFAAMEGHFDIVYELLYRGADVNATARGEMGRTALEGAAEHGRLDIVQLLLNVQAEVHRTRALEFARQEGHDGVVQLLLEHLG